jgi:hypothetical protein
MQAIDYAGIRDPGEERSPRWIYRTSEDFAGFHVPQNNRVLNSIVLELAPRARYIFNLFMTLPDTILSITRRTVTLSPFILRSAKYQERQNQYKLPPPGLYPPLGTQNASWTAARARERSFSEISFNPCMASAWSMAVFNTSSTVSPHASKSQSAPRSLHLRIFSMVFLLLPEKTRAIIFFQCKINHSFLRRQGSERSRGRGILRARNGSNSRIMIFSACYSGK